MSSINKNPPLLSACKSYDDWKKLLDIWRNFTSLDEDKQGPAIVLTLEGEAQDAVLELSTSEISGENGVNKIIERLDKIYKKDELSQKYNALESFETYKRSNDTSIRDFLVEFEKRYNKIKTYGITMVDDLLGFRLIKSANLTMRDEQLVKATISELSYDIVKSKLSKIFSEGCELSTTETRDSNIKIESTYHTDISREEPCCSKTHDSLEEEESQNQDENQYALYAQRNFQERSKQPVRPFPPRLPSNRNQTNNKSNWRSTNRRLYVNQGKNPTDKYGQPTRCSICQSINHWAQNCPDRNNQANDTYVLDDVILHQSHYDNSQELKYLISETWSAALLDCGASKTVCGREWFNQFINNIEEQRQYQVQYSETKHIYRFGDGRKVKAIHSAKIPALLGNKYVNIQTDVIDNDIPLLLSKSSMKKAKMTLDFQNDVAIAFGERIPLITTSSGHYAIPITKSKQIINDSSHNTSFHPNITLNTTEIRSDHQIALKLHRQFAHPSEEKLLRLIKNAGQPWANNDQLLKEIKEVSKTCPTCQIYKKPPPRPVVGLPMASRFQETVAMDLKFYKNKILLHIIDHCTRLSASSVIPNKLPETIIKYIFKIWISVYGSPEKFLTDNGGEFANKNFTEMCETLGITIKTTAAESPWSNGLVERHNLVLSDMLDRVLSENNCDIDLAVAWCINAKNSLYNIHGFSPYQLALGTNPNLPSTLTDKPPALTVNPSSKIISDNLSTLHIAREAFIKSENSEKIRRALNHNIRTSGDIKYVTGDKVYFKRADSKEWHGPSTVLGQDGQQVLLKNGSSYVRVHPCRLQLVNSINQNNINTNLHEIPSPTIHTPQTNVSTEQGIISSDEEDVNVPDKNYKNITQTNSHHTLKLKPNLIICYKSKENEPWIKAKIVSRAGKATGQYKNYWNIEDENKEVQPMDLSSVADLKILNDSSSQNLDIEPVSDSPSFSQQDEETLIHQTLISKCKEETLQAKFKELQQWRQEKVYTEVRDQGQECISLRWVIKEKMNENGKVVKARLCARGFEEEQNFRTDSPTCSREGLRLVCSIIASSKWKLNSLDVKTAFLQGKPIERVVFVRPPKEAETNRIWRLNKCVYGLADASRFWYLKLREELVSLGATPSNLDKGIFFWKRNDKIFGIVACFVDDVLWGGDSEFYSIITKLRETFVIGAEHQKVFEYIGVNLEQHPDFSITLQQHNYIQTINMIPLSPDQSKDRQRPLTVAELTSLRGALGKLNWIAGMTRPEISFQVCEISTKIKSATVEEILSVNKTIKFVRNTPSHITVPSMHLKSLEIHLYSDASFNNLIDGGSQGAYIVFIVDKYKNSNPLAWSSNRLRRVCRSTLAAETLALSDGCDTAFFIQKLMQEILIPPTLDTINIQVFTDNKSLFETLQTTNSIIDRRLRVEISALREMSDRKEIKVNWVTNDHQLSDVLTKRGASHKLLTQIIQDGRINQ